ncbi:MAG: Uma2 family endonuclease, partial [Prochlorothrix sp.]|nr:Uma2 family endonuclease [Prochlorothrix sp.]
GDKFADYQTLDSLQEYILVNSHRCRVECFRRTDRGLWLYQSYTPNPDPLSTAPEKDPSIELQSLNLQIPLSDLYEDVIFEPEPDPTPNNTGP